jgi:tRNA(Ile)-lysidine synthase TilS/MesJ
MTIRALGLFGGGLDSFLAREWLKRQGVEIECVHFRTGFVIEAYDAGPVETIDVSRDYLRQVVLEPKYGYGSAMNPCVDCRIFMLRRASELARSRGIDLLFTGEVVGQRAMDQSRHALATTEREAGVEGRVLRPLSAGLLEPTDAERDGRLALGERPRLHGSTRRGQLELARRLGIEGFPTPSGRCCKLADPAFARRLRDLLEHRDDTALAEKDLERLDRGRHFRLAWDLKVIVGRDETESRWLVEHAGDDWVAQAADGRGAPALVEGTPREETSEALGAVIARYAGQRGEEAVEVELRRGDERRRLFAKAASEDELARKRI